MKGDLSGRIALVTGASSGIGRACAFGLAAAGASVVVNYFGSEDAAAKVVAAIKADGGQAIDCRADVGEEAEVVAMFSSVRDQLGTPDILVNNAGIQRDASLVDMSVEAWDAVLKTNLRGQFLCARECAKGLSSRGETHAGRSVGSIIFISSVHDRIPWAGHANYAASKGGIDMLMRSVALELGAKKIRVNAVAPGAIKTNINRAMWESEEGRRDVLEKIPYGRIGDPEDIARAVCWLASADSDYVHGHTLYVDGGMTLYPSFLKGG